MAILQLGSTDEGKIPSDKMSWLAPFHRAMDGTLKKKVSFRGEVNGKWLEFKSNPGREVRELQEFLQQVGFFPKALKDGVFGYGTRSALRLFQEYVRNVEGEKSMGTPDGVFGPATQQHINRWKQNRITNNWIKNFTLENPSPEYVKWMEILTRAQIKYLSADNAVIRNLKSFNKPSDTLPPGQWAFRPADTHLIGIRCAPEVEFTDRLNDDLFVLLLQGMVFTFWGSTDPNPKLITESVKKTSGAPFLTEGQHRYRFGWHKITSEDKVYMALKPAGRGVLVFRDRNNRSKLLNEDVERGFDPPNNSINIHWTPDAARNWSAGCQVISGESYMDCDSRIISCRDYCAKGYDDLGNGKTRGAYNVLADLVITFAPKDNEIVWYTLGRLENFIEVAPELGSDFIETKLNRLLQK